MAQDFSVMASMAMAEMALRRTLSHRRVVCWPMLFRREINAQQGKMLELKLGLSDTRGVGGESTAPDVWRLSYYHVK